MFNERVQGVIDAVDALRDTVDDHWQIPADEGRVLAQIIRVGHCASLCEIGVSYGFSTLHLAAATQPMGGHVHAFELSDKKIAASSKHLDDAGLSDVVTIHAGDARETGGAFTPEVPYDFVFIDAVKEQSFDYLDAVLPHCAARVMIATDNTTTHANELSEFVAHLRSLPGASSCGVAVGNGFELTLLDR